MMSTKDERNKTREDTEEEKPIKFAVLDGIRILGGLVLLSSLVSYMIHGNMLWNYNPWWARPKALSQYLRGPIILTDAELLSYNGSDDSKPLYIALNGTMFDVSAGRRIYSPGGPYNFFAGRDAARAYVTGCFKEDSVPDYRGAEWTFIPKDVPRFSEVPDSELDEQRKFYRYEEVEKGLREVEGTMEHWAKVFRGETGKDYFEVGRVKREEGWMESLELRDLCESAEKKRPKGRFEEGKVYGRPERMRGVREVRRWQMEGKEKSEKKDNVVRDEL